MHAVRIAGPMAAIMFVALLSLHAASAQSNASITLTVPSGPNAIAQGATATVPVKVAFTIHTIVCAPGPSTATVNLAVTEASPLQGLSFSLPSTVTFDLKPPIAYSSTGAFSDEQTVNLNATLVQGSIPNHNHPINVTAKFTAAQDLKGCTTAPAGQSYDATASGPSTFVTGAGTATTTTGNATGSMTGSVSGTTSKASVSLPLALEVALLLGIGLVVSRKQA